MLKSKNLPKKFAAEGMACAIYYWLDVFQEALIIWLHKSMVQMEAVCWTFDIIGYVAYVHIPNQPNTKLNDKGEKCIFLCYSQVTKGYKFSNPMTGKLIISTLSLDSKASICNLTVTHKKDKNQLD